jgi:F-type H+-transporting ATPase subunit epsilon
MAEATAKKLQCVIVTPESTVFDKPVDFVAVPLYDGELGVLPGRAPLVARLGYGELRTTSAGTTTSYYIDGGFLQVNRDVVCVLTAQALAAAGIDPAQARAKLDEANRETPTTPEGFSAKTISLSRARAQIAIAQKAGKS